MKAHQRIIKEQTRKEDLKKYGDEIFLADLSEYTLQKEEVSQEIKDYIFKYEYLRTWGVSPRWVFTARIKGVLACVECLNLPNAYSKILGDGTRELECLIQRGACASYAHPHTGSKTLMFAINWMVQNTEKRVFSAYADVTGGELGIIYQCLNFDFLGFKFGTKFLCVHPDFKDGKPFSPQSLRRTALLKKWYKETYGEALPKDFLNPKSGFKDMKKIALLTEERGMPDVRRLFYDYGDSIIKQSQRIELPPKGRYILVKGKDKREQRLLDARKNYKTHPYPKRNDPKYDIIYEKYKNVVHKLDTENEED